MAATDISQLDAEYLALTERCGLLDRSERGKLALTGPGAKAFLAGQVTNDTESLASGTGCYAAFLTSKGKMLGDMRILDLGEELFLDTERVALQALFDMIRRFKIGYEVELHKRTLECSLLSLIGPFSGPVATLALDHNRQADLVQPKGLGLPEIEHSHREDHIAGCPVRIVATDRWGIDVICAAADRDSVWDGLRENGAHVVDGQTAEIVRIERGRLVHEGLLRRAGDCRAPVLQGQAEPPPARSAYVRIRGAGRGAALGRTLHRAPLELGPLPRPRPDRPGARAPRGRAGEHRLRR
jgi:glycine cleavage system aminomethyltransferase T